jgi:putative membrane protein
MPKNLFTQQQIKEIEGAVKHAESACGAEIVPVFVRQSSLYEIALWRGGVLASILAAVVLVVLFFSTDWLLFLPPYFWYLIPLTTGILGSLLVIISPYLRRKVIGRGIMQSKVEQKAREMFFNHKVSYTLQRSGVLLMISFFERKAVILADVGITEAVENSVWQEIVNELTHGIREGRMVESITGAIAKCGKVVADSGLMKGEDDANELSDEIIFEG